MFFVSKSVADTRAFALKLLEDFKDRSQRATVLGLQGELGAGKTTFTQELARVLGITERVTSPTYVIFKTYDLPPTTHNTRFKKLVHIDAYRLNNGKDLEMLGWNDLINDPTNLIVLEWPEKVADILPSDIVNIVFDPINATTRNIEVTYGKEKG